MSHWALQYLGAPWVSGQSGPVAYDCYGLVRAVYRDVLGIDLPVIDVTQAEPLRLRHAMEQQAGAAWLDVHTSAELDVVLMSHGKHPHHVGLWSAVDGGRVVHAVEGAGVVAQSLAALQLAGWRVLGYHRRADACALSV